MTNRTSRPSTLAELLDAGLMWLLLEQNADGSWGTSLDERVVYTPHAIQLLAELDPAAATEPMARAVSWLSRNVTPGGHEHWTGRIPALIAAKRFTEVQNDLANFDGLWDTAQGESLFWHVVPILFSILTHRKDIPYSSMDAALDALLPNFRGYELPMGQEFIHVGGKPNHTGLAALLLHHVDAAIYQTRITKMIAWIEHSIRRHDSYSNWDNSIGVTSYVLYDLKYLQRAGYRINISMAPLFVNFYLARFQYERGSFLMGFIGKDSYSVTFDTPLHEGTLYTTTLTLRAITAWADALAIDAPASLRRALSSANAMTRTTRLLRSGRRQRTLWLSLGGSILATIAFVIVLLLGARDFIVSVATSSITAFASWQWSRWRIVRRGHE